MTLSNQKPAMNKALFLDRDGIINVDRGYIYRSEDFEFTEGIFDLCRLAKDKGYIIVVVTNQSGIERGFFSTQDYESLTAHMLKEFERNGVTIDDVFVCPFLEHADRKPAPGMLIKARRKHDIDMSASLMVGDKPSDIEAARAAGVGKLALLSHKPSSDSSVLIVRNLKEVEVLL